MAKENKQIESLMDGSEVYSTKAGWDKEKMKNQPVQAAGWKEGASPHFSISKGLMLAVVHAPEKFPDVIVGKYDADGTEVPVVDPNKITDLVINAFCDKYDIEPEKVRVATSRITTKKAGQLEMFKGMEEAGVDAATLTLLKAKFGL